MRTRIPFLLLLAALPLTWLACDDSSSDTGDTTSPDVSDDDDDDDDDNDGTSPTTDDDDLTSNTGGTGDSSDDDDDVTDTTSADDDDDSVAACESVDITAYLDSEPVPAKRSDWLCSGDNKSRCDQLVAREHSPCNWGECESGAALATRLGKCGFCTSDADCTHPNSGFGPGATCGADEVAPGVRFCVEANGGNWTPGDCSPQDVERFIFSDGEPLILYACSPTVAVRCNYDVGVSLPCGWSKENCAKWDFSGQDDKNLPECDFCVYDAHCRIGTCTGEWGDGARYCVNPPPNP